MRVSIDRSRCTSLGVCESMAPDHFEVDDEGELVVLREDVIDAERARVEQAVAGCPTAALTLLED